MSEQHDFFANMTENKDKGYVIFDADGQGICVGAPTLEAAQEYATANGAFPMTLH